MTVSPDPMVPKPQVSRNPVRSIGQVLAALKGDFPDISISKIRFLETEGLVTPERAPSGYRRYVESDIERLRYVLTVQRDHYLPLKVIREHLSLIDRGEAPPGRAGAAATGCDPGQPGDRLRGCGRPTGLPTTGAGAASYAGPAHPPVAAAAAAVAQGPAGGERAERVGADGAGAESHRRPAARDRLLRP